MAGRMAAMTVISVFDDVVALGCAEPRRHKRPGGHVEQEVLPSVGEKLPGEHGVHFELPVPCKIKRK